MDNSILTKESLINEIVYTPSNFLEMLIMNAVSYDIITEEDSQKYLQILFKCLFEYSVSICANIGKYKGNKDQQYGGDCNK